jgi:hypothetical protein
MGETQSQGQRSPFYPDSKKLKEFLTNVSGDFNTRIFNALAISQ